MKRLVYNSISMKGLTEKQARGLLVTFGENKIETARKVSLVTLLLDQYKNSISFILFIASLFSFIIREFTDMIFILFVLVSNGLFSFFQEFKAEKTLEKLKDFTVAKSRIIREGKEKEIDAREIVPGDTVILREGDRIPADGSLISHLPMEVDESVFTGESFPVEKAKEDLLLSGTFVTRGRGEMTIDRTGLKTKIGEIAKAMSEIKKSKTPLASNMDILGRKIAIFTILFCFFLIPVGLSQGRNLKQLILTIISLSVAVIPEGLPLVVTVALAVGVYRMAKERAIVRKMDAIETLGATNVILTDKTGTLTKNRMSVKEFWLPTQENLKLLLRACVLGNTATIIEKENRKGFEILGDKTDAAFLLFVKDRVKDIEFYRNEGKIIFEKPFDPITKTVEIEWEEKDKKHYFVRGAPESVVQMLEENTRRETEDKFTQLAKKGLRVIGFAHKGGQGEFKLLGLIGIYDPPREEAKEALYKAREAGIRVVMVTGDNPETAKNISEEVGLIEKDELVMTSSDLEKLTDDNLLEILPRVRIFARTRPEDKLRLVKLYKKAGFIVAVTGDGVNDSLALQESNIGVAMGEKGTDVAKEAADIVITDDNFYTVVKAVEEGRAIFNNILKVILYLLSTNVAEFLVIALAILIKLPIPLLPTQILWINLVSDGLPSLALASDIKRTGLLTGKPRNIKEQILNKERLVYIVLIGLIIALITLGIFVFSLGRFSEDQARLITFDIFVGMEFVVVFIIRGGIFPLNKFLIGSIILSVLLQLLVTVSPGLRSLFS